MKKDYEDTYSKEDTFKFIMSFMLSSGASDPDDDEYFECLDMAMTAFGYPV